MKTGVKLQPEALEAPGPDMGVDTTNMGVAASGGVATHTGDTAREVAARGSAHCALDVSDAVRILACGYGTAADHEIAEPDGEEPTFEEFVPEDSAHLTVSHGKVPLHGQADTWGRYDDAELALRHLSLTKLKGSE
jgi:hypothetical protein